MLKTTNKYIKTITLKCDTTTEEKEDLQQHLNDLTEKEVNTNQDIMLLTDERYFTCNIHNQNITIRIL